MITTINEFKKNLIIESKDTDIKKIEQMKSKLEEMGLKIISYNVEYEQIGQIELPEVTYQVVNHVDDSIATKLENFIMSEFHINDARVQLHPTDSDITLVVVDLF